MAARSCVDEWLVANPDASGREHLQCAGEGTQRALEAADPGVAVRELAAAMEALGVWLGLRIVPTGRSFWDMEPRLRRRFPDYAWPVMASIQDLRDEILGCLDSALDRRTGTHRTVNLEDAQRWGRRLNDELCDLLEVLKDPRSAPG